MYIEFESSEYEDGEIMAKNSGVVYFIRQQNALLFKEGEKYPDKFTHRLAFSDNRQKRDNSQPIPPGQYIIDEQSFYIDRYGGVRLGELYLKPMKQNTLSKIASK